MGASILKRITLWALKIGSTYGTAPTFGAGDGLRANALGGIQQEPNIIPDVTAGQQLETNAHIGIDKTPQVTVQGPVQENDPVMMTMLAAIFGDDTVTGGSDPYSHTMNWQVESNQFFCVSKQEGDEVKTCPSVTANSLEISFDGNGILQFNMTGTGNRIVTSAAGSLDTVTFPAVSNVYKLSSTVFRINAQSGDALDSDDALEVADLVIRPERATDTVIVAGADAIAQPKEGAYPSFMVSFTIPRKNAMSKTLHAAMLAGTRMKADLTITGTTANRKLVLTLPQLQIETCTNPDADVIATNVTMRAQKAGSAPTGMTGITVPRVVWTCGVSADLVP